MAITPNTDLYLLKCPLESDQRNQLTFGSRSAQQTYFNGLPKLALEDFSYQRKDGYIRAPYHIDDIMGYNYVMYQNKNYSNRWFYAFITRMEYVSDKCTNIYIKTDVYQTWAMDITDKASYVEREHVNDDTIGANTIPEGLDTGEYVCNGVSNLYYAKNQTYDAEHTPSFVGSVMICIQLTTLKTKIGDVTDEPYNPPTDNIINGVPQGVYTIGIPYSTFTMADIYSLIVKYDAAGKSDAIVSMFLCPRDVCGWDKLQGAQTSIWGSGHFYKAVDNYSSYSGGTLSIYRNTTIDGYTPKNNKLFVAPYNYFHITNNAGSDIEFYYEDFDYDQINYALFSSTLSMDLGGSCILVPENSKRSGYRESALNFNSDNSYNEGIMGAKLPQISWSSDYYLNWQAQNGKNIAVQTGLQAVGMGLNILNPIASSAASHALDVETAVERGHFPDEEHMSVNAGGPLGSVVNFASQVANTQNAIRQAKMVPPQVRGQSATGTIQFADDKCKFTAFKMSIREEYARAIDGYFSMYGYKVNRVKIPNFIGRQNWNYVKTIGFNCEGDVPQADLQEYKNLFDNGITLWHNPTTFMDYSQNNNIV